MNTSSRDLLVLSKKVSLDPQELEHEVEMLHVILFHTETISNFCQATELIDVNRYKIIKKAHLIEQVAKEEKTAPFVFLFNKN